MGSCLNPSRGPTLAALDRPMQDLDSTADFAPPDGFTWDDLAECPEALDAALRGDWSGVGGELDEAA